MSNQYPIVEQDLELVQGESLRMDLAFVQATVQGGQNTTPVDITGQTITVTIQWKAGSWGAAGSVIKTSPSSGVTITNAAQGTAQVFFSTTDIALVPTNKNSRWRLTLTSGSDVNAYGLGDVTVRPFP